MLISIGYQDHLLPFTTFTTIYCRKKLLFPRECWPFFSSHCKTRAGSPCACKPTQELCVPSTWHGLGCLRSERGRGRCVGDKRTREYLLLAVSVLEGGRAGGQEQRDLFATL